MSRRAIVLLVVAVLASGCGPQKANDEGTTVAAEQNLRDKPSLEEAQAEYRTAVEAMSQRIADLTPGTTWAFSDQTPWLACSGDDVGTDAKHAYFAANFEQPIPDAAWSRALQIVTDGAATFGATELSTFKDEPGNHDVAIAGPDGVEFKLGTKKKASLTAQSDCRLSEADK